MIVFDYYVITFINQFSQKSLLFDSLMKFLSNNGVLKGGILTIIIWSMWFKKEENDSPRREHITITLLSCIISMMLARGAALMLPFRIRPLHEESLNFLLPYGMRPTELEGWSSFPSDHAVLFFALSAGLIFVSRRAGIFTLIHTTLFIAFPRVYLGLHYPTDIIAGAIIGITIVVIGNRYLVKNLYIQSIVNWSYSKPHLFYPVFFLVTYQIADLFNGSREIVGFGLRLIGN